MHDDDRVDEILRRASRSSGASLGTDSETVLDGMRPRLTRARAAHRLRITTVVGIVVVAVVAVLPRPGGDRSPEQFATGPTSTVTTATAEPRGSASPSVPASVTPSPSTDPVPIVASVELPDGVASVRVSHDGSSFTGTVETDPADGFEASVTESDRRHVLVSVTRADAVRRFELTLVDGAVVVEEQTPDPTPLPAAVATATPAQPSSTVAVPTPTRRPARPTATSGSDDDHSDDDHLDDDHLDDDGPGGEPEDDHAEELDD